MVESLQNVGNILASHSQWELFDQQTESDFSLSKSTRVQKIAPIVDG